MSTFRFLREGETGSSLEAFDSVALRSSRRVEGPMPIDDHKEVA